MNQPDIISLALAEDLGDGDVTSRFFIAENARAKARIVARQPCVLAGAAVAEEVFRRMDGAVAVNRLRRDGEHLVAGDPVLEIAGRARPLLAAERTALNFIQRLSGVATQTNRFVKAVRGTKAVILDTRKTTPGMRQFEKAAVVAGGGANHRMGLFDMAMVKDNHLAAGGVGLRAAIRELKASRPEVLVELEADTLAQVRAFLEIDGVDRILLDNMPPETLREAVRLAAGRVALEASGGITLENAGAIAATGVDFLSIGALTHSAPAMDFGFDFET